MHHGFYPKGAPPKSNQQAQIDMIEEALGLAGVQGATKARAVRGGALWHSHALRKPRGAGSRSGPGS